MSLAERIHNISQFQLFLTEFLSVDFQDDRELSFPEHFYLELKKITETVVHHNGWFVKENVLHALSNWKDNLTHKKLVNWIKPYHLKEVTQEKRIGIIMAGNIPMVGFHDLISILLSGHHALIKLSSNDDQLIPFLVKVLIHINPEFNSKITFVQQKLEGFDAVIATGSNNTARYFEYYFKGKPHIIRKNRTSVAVLTGMESEKDLENLGEDILRYFGMGCRNVSKLFIPKDFDLDRFFKGIFSFQNHIHHHKYQNNYDYHKAIFLMNQDSIIENGFLILKEDSSYHSPISTLFYERYENLEILQKRLKEDAEKLQCVVGQNILENEVGFGETQKPDLTQYADGIDTIEFLKNL
ncbi:MAG: acyl-CoA reductase [Flavobacteriales bacterium]